MLTLFIIMFVVGILSASAICIFTEPVDASMLEMDMSSVIYYENDDGEEVLLQSLFDDENRVWVDFENIPLNLKNAFVAIEDERFFTHPGFDFKRTLSAAFNSVIRVFDKNRAVYGGSTITQQLVKNLTGDDKRSILRKLQEIYRAVRLEKDLGKNEILELYLNTIYLSQKCNGVSTASRVYFSKDVSNLSLAECACLAGITQYPSKYDPYINPEANKEKQEVVLKKMLELGFISEKEYKEAINETLEFKRSPNFSNSVYSYFVDSVIEEVSNDLVNKYNYTEAMAQQMLYTGGLKIKCTIDPEIQSLLESVYTDPSSFVTKNGELMQSAMVVTENSTGEIKGIVGGMGEKTGSLIFNHAYALRQPGSTIKPIGVYAPALEYGVIHSASTIEDVPTTFTLSDGSTWSPRNSGGSFSGTVTIRTAVARSLNIPAAKILDKMGIDVSFSFMSKNLGISSLVVRRKTESGIVSDKALAALSLGGLTDGISPIEMSGAYAAIANDGIYIEPHTYTEIYDLNGELLFTNRPETHRAMKSSTAVITTDLLKSVVSGGTGSSAYFNGPEIAGKTGTTTNDYDRWFVGYTPAYTGVTWVGYDIPTSINAYGNPAIPLWKAVMSKIDYKNKPTSFRAVLSYDDLEYVDVCLESGLLVSDCCIEAGTVQSILISSDNIYDMDICDESYHEKEEEEDNDVPEENQANNDLSEDENTQNEEDIPPAPSSNENISSGASEIL